MQTRMHYRMGQPNPQKDYVRPVNKVITKQDGKAEYVQMEKKVADSLEEFRKAFPNEPVDGAPMGDELQLVMSDLTDEQLAQLGLERKATDMPSEPEREEVATVATFASEDAEIIALEAGLEAGDLPPEGGSGQNGAYTTADIRKIAAMMEVETATEKKPALAF